MRICIRATIRPSFCPSSLSWSDSSTSRSIIIISCTPQMQLLKSFHFESDQYTALLVAGSYWLLSCSALHLPRMRGAHCLRSVAHEASCHVCRAGLTSARLLISCSMRDRRFLMLWTSSVATRRLTASMSMCQVKMVRLAAWSALRGRSCTGSPTCQPGRTDTLCILRDQSVALFAGSRSQPAGPGSRPEASCTAPPAPLAQAPWQSPQSASAPAASSTATS